MSWDHTRSPFARWVLDDAGAGLLSYVPLQDEEFAPGIPVQSLGQSGHPWGTGGTRARTDGPATGDAGALRLFDEPSRGAYFEETAPAETRVPAFAGQFTMALWVRHAAGDNTTWGRLTGRDGWVNDSMQFQVVSPGADPNDALSWGIARDGSQHGSQTLQNTAGFGDPWTWWVATWREQAVGGDSRIRVYRNGVLIRTGNVANPPDGWATTPNRFSGIATPGIEWTDLAHHAVWDRALSAEEIAAGWAAAARPAPRVTDLTITHQPPNHARIAFTMPTDGLYTIRWARGDEAPRTRTDGHALVTDQPAIAGEGITHELRHLPYGAVSAAVFTDDGGA